ncbi:MAG: Uma2 family endonuclease [Microscillaceae bacterium]|jgi:Uma2 family endonuclease|nr:Uma2 family endonuclease [Microscillaceae bacterium]
MLIAEKKYTIAEFISLDELDENFYYELINGEIVKKSSPTPWHQLILARVYDSVGNFVKTNQLGTVFFAPVDVFLDKENLVIPDLIYISNTKKSIITNNGIEGSPDLIVEILSPSTAKYDRDGKMKTYKRNQIDEYWIIDPKAQSIEVYIWQNGDYDLLTYAVEGGKIESKVLAGLSLSAQELFND